MDPIVSQWIERAEYDLETARHLHKTGRYLYVAFMCQQSLEKYLKAFLSHQGQLPPFTHNLIKLAQDSRLIDQMTEDDKILLSDLNPFYIKARYGEYKQSLSKICSEEMAALFVSNTERFILWLKQKLK